MAATATVTGERTVLLQTDDPGPGAWYRAYSGNPDRLIGTGPTTTDLWAPLGVPIAYYWRSGSGIQQTGTVTVPAARPVLSSALSGAWAEVTVISQPPLRWEGRSVAHPVLGRNEPLVTVAKPQYHSAELVLHAPDMRQRVALRELLRTGHPLILRTPCPDAVDDVTLLPLQWEEEVRGGRPSGPRRVSITYQAVMDNPSQYTPLPEWTWQDLAVAETSWDDVVLKYPTWTEAAAGP